MKAVQRPCNVPHVTASGTPRVIELDGWTHHLSQELDRDRAGGRWWLGEPSREVWVLACGPVMLELCRYDEDWNGGEWWVLRVQD